VCQNTKQQTDFAFLANCKQMFVFHILLMFAKLANRSESVLRMQLGIVFGFFWKIKRAGHSSGKLPASKLLRSSTWQGYEQETSADSQ
jgi:hypothetical protein